MTRRRHAASRSFDHLVGPNEQLVRYGQAKRLGGLEVDRQLVLGRRLHRKVGRLLALEDAIDVAGRAPELVDHISPIGDQAAVERCPPFDRGPRVVEPSMYGRARPPTGSCSSVQPAVKPASVSSYV